MRNIHKSGAKSTRFVTCAWKNLSSGVIIGPITFLDLNLPPKKNEASKNLDAESPIQPDKSSDHKPPSTRSHTQDDGPAANKRPSSCARRDSRGRLSHMSVAAKCSYSPTTKLFPDHERHKAVRKNRAPRTRIIRRCGRRRPEFRRDYENVVGLRVQGQRARPLLRRDVFRHAELIGRFFFHHGQHAFAAGSK